MVFRQVIQTVSFGFFLFILTGFFPLALTDAQSSHNHLLLTQNNSKNQDAGTLFKQGLEQFNNGNIEQAIALFKQALNLHRQNKNPLGEANTLGNIGVAYRAKGDYTQAFNYLEQTLVIMEEINNIQGQWTVLQQLALTYRAVGNSVKAQELLTEQLKLSENANNQGWIAGALANLGLVYLDLGDYNKAISTINRQLKIARETNNIQSEETGLFNLGLVYEAKGNYAEATNLYQQVLEIRKKRNDQVGIGYLQGNLGLLYRAQKQYRKAVTALQKYLETTRSVNDLRGQSAALNNLGVTYYELGEDQQAERYLKEGMKLQESLRIGLDDDKKISFLDSQKSTYQTLQLALIEQNKIKEALEISERSRARAFVDLLARNNNLEQGKESVTPLSFSKIQAIAKQHNSWLVEYSLITVNSELFIWVVSPQGELNFKRVKLENLDSLVTQNLELIVNGIVTASTRSEDKLIPKKGDRLRLTTDRKSASFQPWIVESVDIKNQEIKLCHPDWENCANPKLVPFSEIASIVNNNNPQNTYLQKLYSILIKPIVNYLPTDPNQKIIFIPHQDLFFVPFPALQDETGKYLIEKHTILTAPSIQVLDLTYQQKQKIKQNPKSDILIMGNPTMPRVSFGNNPPYTLSALPYSETEAKAIATLFNAQPLLGNQAPKKVIIPRMQQARIIHFATHGLLGDFNKKGVPGAIALTEELLTSEDIFSLQLTAELAVLSACETGGGNITGDGVIGLSRSFISAGIPSVIVSLWRVDDLATSELMVELYQQLKLTGNKAIALRNAMLVTKQKYYEPRLWAGFTLIGEAE